MLFFFINDQTNGFIKCVHFYLVNTQSINEMLYTGKPYSINHMKAICKPYKSHIVAHMFIHHIVQL